VSETPLSVFLDANDAEWTSQRYYVDSLREEFRRHERVHVVDEPGDADVVHLNYLNPLGRIVHGKADRWRHLRDVAGVFAGFDAPVVLTEHGVEEFSDAGESMYIESNRALQKLADATKRQVSRVFATQVDAIIAISSMDRDYLVDAGFEPSSVHHVPHGVEARFLNARDGEVDDFVLHVSKCSPHKNPRGIIEVARRLDATLKIAGSGWQENHGAELSPIENVDVLGYVPEDELVDLYSSARAFYFPSTYEPFGLPILEAMACGTPVVSSVNSAAPDIDGDGITLVEPDDVDQHVAELERLLEDDELRESRARAAVESANSFTWTRTANSTAEVYEQLASN
jgi:alpha-1,3-rhamnosyl/mannosyltransferase